MSEIKTLSIDEVIPYWRNPRDINEEAVSKVAESIEKYGYQQPILVDRENVIIAGHTRYKALRRLGHTEVAVIVSDLPSKQANEYRVVDNRTSEYATWDEDLLLQELREFSEETLESFFPDIDLGLDFSDLDAVTGDDNENAASNVSGQKGTEEQQDTISVFCTHCFSEVKVGAAQFLEIADDYRAAHGQ